MCSEVNLQGVQGKVMYWRLERGKAGRPCLPLGDSHSEGHTAGAWAAFRVRRRTVRREGSSCRRGGKRCMSGTFLTVLRQHAVAGTEALTCVVQSGFPVFCFPSVSAVSIFHCSFSWFRLMVRCHWKSLGQNAFCSDPFWKSRTSFSWLRRNK